ncbi:ABC transporter permease [Bradyrhizobium sp. AZCC 2230]|uniref:ABC transporter permease n=1 Tax=Bradyrhizobium sp. AZCC 2230 TaxID=3117021 RepID=UPI002FF23F16
MNTANRLIDSTSSPGTSGDDVRITIVAPDVTPVGSAQDEIRQAPTNQYTSRAITIGSFLMAWLVVGLLWEVLTAKGVLNGRVLVPPSVFLPYLLQGQGAAGIGYNKVTFDTAILATLMRVATGFILALSVSLLGAILICAVRPFRLALLPLARTIAPIAPVAWIPLAITVVGLGSGAAIFVVFMGLVGSATVAAVAALDDVPDEYRKVARLLGAAGASYWLRVIVPAAASGLVTTMRMSFFGAFMAVLAGEMAGINSGLGALIILGQQQFNMKLVMSGIVVIGLLGFVVDQLLAWIGHRVVWWEGRQRRWKAPK